MSITEIVFAVIAIVATIVPTICNAIAIHSNNKTNIKLEKVKQFDIERIKALNDFIKESHLYFSLISNNNNSDIDTIKSYHSDMIYSLLKLQLYFELPTETRQKLFMTERKGGYEDDWNFRNELIVFLSNQVNSYIKK